MKDHTACIDWPRLLGDIAWLLGEDEPNVPNSRQPLSEVRLAATLGFSRGKLRNIISGTSFKVEYHDGCALILLWSRLSGKDKEYVPITMRSISASAVKEGA